MNVLKSALKFSKPHPISPLQSLYQDVKLWDEARARILQQHLKIVQLAMDALDRKVSQVQLYMQGLDKLMSARIEQITSYCKNGVNGSQFFLLPCSLKAMKPCHQMLKHLLMQQSQREQNLSKKGAVLAVILQKLKRIRSVDSEQSHHDSIREMKSGIRFLIDCELQDVIVEVLEACKAVSVAFGQEKQFYLSVEKFARVADRQVQKHREIGKELIDLLGRFAQRQKELRVKLREILIEWVREDLEDKIFQQQLCKKPTEDLIDQYYDIQNLIPQHCQIWKGQSLEEYLQGLQVLPFRQHEKVVVYSRQAFYNGKIEAKVIVTEQKEVYLFRLQSNEPDFSFILGKNIKIKEKGPLIVQISQVRKSMFLREETDFQFILQFNLEGDLKEFERRCVGLGCNLESK